MDILHSRRFPTPVLHPTQFPSYSFFYPFMNFLKQLYSLVSTWHIFILYPVKWLSSWAIDMGADPEAVRKCFNQAPRHEGVLWEWRYSSTHSDLDTRWRWVVSFTPLPLYPQGKNLWYPMDRRRLGGLQSRSGRGGVEKNSKLLSGLEPPIQLIAQR
jgi:hypothetical protein